MPIDGRDWKFDLKCPGGHAHEVKYTGMGLGGADCGPLDTGEWLMYSRGGGLFFFREFARALIFRGVEAILRLVG